MSVHELRRPWQRVLPCPCGASPVGLAACCGTFLCEACYQIHSDERLDAVGAFTGFDRVRMSWSYWVKGFFWGAAYRLGYRRRRGHRGARRSYELPPDPEWFPCPGYVPR